MIDPLLPFRVANWWAGLTLGLAYEASKLVATSRSRPVTPTREALAAELKAMPASDAAVLPRPPEELLKAFRQVVSKNPATRAAGEAAMRRFATAKPAAAKRAARRRPS